MYTTLKKCADGVKKYELIMSALYNTDVSQDKTFQRRYNDFYKMIKKPSEYYKEYYGYLESVKGNKKTIKFEEVLMHFHSKFNRFEKSFVSKLVHTVNPTKPIRDQFVLKNLGLEDPGRNKDLIVETYYTIEQKLNDMLNNDKGKHIISVFNEIYPGTSITDIKKIDFYLRQCRP